MTSDPHRTTFPFVHHHHRPSQSLNCNTKPLRKKIFRKKAQSVPLGDGGGGNTYNSDYMSPQHDLKRNSRRPSVDSFDLILQAAELLDASEVETVVADEDYALDSGEETATCTQQVTPETEFKAFRPDAPPLSPASSFSSNVDNRSIRSEFITGLVDFADELISSIWQKPSNAMQKTDSVIPMRQFIQEVLRRSQSSYGTLSLGLYYLGRASRRPLPQHLRDDNGEFPWCKCSRRMFLAALILATKFLHDRAYTNRAWAKLAGLTTREVGNCERALLEWLNWELYVSPPVFIKWQSDVFKRVRANMTCSSLDKGALLTMMNEKEAEDDDDLQSQASSSATLNVCLDLELVKLEENDPVPIPPKVNTQVAYDRITKRLIELQQQRQQLARRTTQDTQPLLDQVDAQIQSIVSLLAPVVEEIARKRVSSCAQENAEVYMHAAKRSRVM